MLPSKLGHDIAQNCSFNDYKDRGDLKGVVIGIECIGKPASSKAILISTMVELRRVRELGTLISNS